MLCQRRTRKRESNRASFRRSEKPTEEAEQRGGTGNDMLAAVILSGGSPSRMGSPKALLAYQGRPFLEHLLEITVHPKIGVRRIVLGKHADPIGAAIHLG